MTQESNKTEKATLYLVATPIGNLSDISPRAIKVLSECDFIAAEDTRNTRKLLTHFDIRKELVSYHEHNKKEMGERLCDRIEAGETCALVTDAGMPAISDPGEDIVRLCAKRHIAVSVIPGCCAAVSALSLSALATGRFAFEGFLPAQKKEKEARLEKLQEEERTMILYEAPHRLKETLSHLLRTFGDERQISLCRELTKRNEEILRMTMADAISYYNENEPRGEYVLIVEGLLEAIANGTAEAPKKQNTALPEEVFTSALKHIAYYEAQGMPHKEAIKAAARDREMSKSDFYAIAIKERETL